METQRNSDKLPGRWVLRQRPDAATGKLTKTIGKPSVFAWSPNYTNLTHSQKSY